MDISNFDALLVGGDWGSISGTNNDFRVAFYDSEWSFKGRSTYDKDMISWTTDYVILKAEITASAKEQPVHIFIEARDTDSDFQRDIRVEIYEVIAYK